MEGTYQEHLNAAALNPVIEDQTSDDFFLSYCPADDAAMLDYFSVGLHRIMFTEITRRIGELGPER
jgi:hypothetical protein